MGVLAFFFNPLFTSKTYGVLEKLVVWSQAVLHFYIKVGKSNRSFEFILEIKTFKERRILELTLEFFLYVRSDTIF